MPATLLPQKNEKVRASQKTAFAEPQAFADPDLEPLCWPIPLECFVTLVIPSIVRRANHLGPPHLGATVAHAHPSLPIDLYHDPLSLVPPRQTVLSYPPCIFYAIPQHGNVALCAHLIWQGAYTITAPFSYDPQAISTLLLLLQQQPTRHSVQPRLPRRLPMP